MAETPRIETALLRFGLIATGALCWKAATEIWASGTATGNTLSLALMIAGYAVGFAVMIAGIPGAPGRRAGWGVPLGLLTVLAAMVQVHVLRELENGVVFTTDAQMYMDYGARLLAAGENPYAHDLAAAYRANQAPFYFATPLTDGGLTGRMAYPALSVLVFLPFEWLGVDGDWVYPTFMVLALAILYRGVRPALRPVVLLPLFADANHINYALGGVTDWVWALLVVLVIRSWDRPVARGIWFGLACSFKHHPWILAPYLLIRIWQETPGERSQQVRAALGFAGIATAVFLAVNLPFIVWDARAWFAGVLEPVGANMITYGQGLSALTMYGVVVVPKGLYSGFMLLAIGLSAWIYARHFRPLRELVWLLPGIILWFGNRSLTSYWYFSLGPLLYAMFRDPPMPSGREGAGEGSWRPTAWALTVALVLVAAGVGGSARRPASFGIEAPLPMVTDGHSVRRLQLRITNHEEIAVEPRFSVQTTGMQPFFWAIHTGPRYLGPGETADYEIRTELPFARFDIRRGARLTVSDARIYHARTALLIPGEPQYVYADVIPNGDFHYWERYGERLRPTFWGVIGDQDEDAEVSVRRGLEGEPGTVVTMVISGTDFERTGVGLDTYIALPEHPLEMWVKLPPRVNVTPAMDVLYGLRVEVGGRRAWILFGDGEGQGVLDEETPYSMIRAPRGAWSRHEIDLRGELTTLGLALEAYRTGIPRFGHLDLPVVPTHVQLVLEARRRVYPVRADFGPLRSTGLRPAVDRLFEDGLQHPEFLAMWRGAYALEGRNFERARGDFVRATELAPDSGRAWFLLAEAEFWAGNWMEAVGAYQKAIDLRHELGPSYKGAAWSLYNADRPDQATRAFAMALYHLEAEEDAGWQIHAADVHKGMAMIAAAAGDCGRAGVDLRKARELNPEVADALGEIEAGCVPATR